MKKNTIVILISLCLFLSLLSCSRSNRVIFKTIPGPETQGVSADLHGLLLFDRPIGGLIGVSLPSNEEIVIRPPGGSPGIVHSVSGPDHQGRIALIENHMTDKRHLLKVYRTNGEELSTIFERKGDALWGDEVGDYLALSPVNGNVAMVVNAQPVQFHNPDAYLKFGSLEIWNIDTKEKLKISQGALDQGLSWFPDGKQLAFVDLVEQKEFTSTHQRDIPPQIGYAKKIIKWHKVPVVSVINIETGEIRRLSPGWEPVVSDDGSQIIIGDYENNRVVFSSTGLFIKSITPPGLVHLGIIYFNQTKILYWGLPTEGTNQKITTNNSPLVGPKPMYTLKVAELESGKFETVIPYIDPRRDLSFGVINQDNKDTQQNTTADGGNAGGADAASSLAPPLS